jgi:hypothetical protein
VLAAGYIAYQRSLRPERQASVAAP